MFSVAVQIFHVRAEQLLRPLNSLQLGNILGAKVAKICVKRELSPANKLVVAGMEAKRQFRLKLVMF